MTSPELRLNTLRRALQAFRNTPGRTGRVVSLVDAGEVLAAGDMHGNVENFRRVLQAADLGRHPRRHLVLQELVHGPFRYPAGGDKSHQLVDLTAALKGQYPRQVHYLLGNHELAQATARPIGKDDEVFNDLFREGVGTAYLGRASEVYALYLELFAALPVAVRTPNRVYLAHSLPSAARLDDWRPEHLERDSTDEDLAPGGAVYALVWGRDTRPETVAAFLAKVDADLLVSGHVPCDNGFEAPNDRQLLLDTIAAPACYCLFPCDRPLTHAELVGMVRTL